MSKQSLYTAIFLIGAVSLLNASEDSCESQRAQYLQHFKDKQSSCAVCEKCAFEFMDTDCRYTPCEFYTHASKASLEVLRQCEAKNKK